MSTKQKIIKGNRPKKISGSLWRSLDKEIKMVDLARKIWQVMDVKKPFKVKYVPGFKFDIKRRVPDVTKVKNQIGWQTKVKFEDGLKEVIRWLERQRDLGKF